MIFHSGVLWLIYSKLCTIQLEISPEVYNPASWISPACWCCANIADTIDPTVRRPKTAAQGIESRLPGLTSAAPSVTDVVGRPVQRPDKNLGGANPFPVTTGTNDPVLKELARLGVSTPQAPTSFKRGGKAIPLTENQRQKLNEQEGQDLYTRLSKIVSGKGWQSLTDDAKRKQVTKIRRQF